MVIAERVYRLSARFPKEEAYGMTSQVRRAAASVAANVAEGHGREHSGSFVQFLRMAQGSLKELETHLLLALRVDCRRKPGQFSSNATSLAECCGH
jgi:four helix bundle protein